MGLISKQKKMKISNQQFLRMLWVVINYLKAAATLMAGKTRLLNSVAKLENLANMIETNQLAQNEDLSALHKGKVALRDSLNTQVEKVGKGMMAVFHQDAMVIEEAKAKSVISGFNTLPEMRVLVSVKELFNLGMAHAARVAEAGIDEAMLNSMKLAGETFHSTVTSNEMTQDGRVQATARINTLVADARRELRLVTDMLMLTHFSETETEFYAGYQKAREISERGRHKKHNDKEETPQFAMVSLVFTDSTTGNPIEGVAIAVDGRVMDDFSDATGELYLDNLTPGAKLIAASAPGYQSREWTTAALEAGKDYEMEEQLSPEMNA